MAYIKKTLPCKEANMRDSTFPVPIYKEKQYAIVGTSYAKKGVPLRFGDEQDIREILATSNNYNRCNIKARWKDHPDFDNTKL